MPRAIRLSLCGFVAITLLFSSGCNQYGNELNFGNIQLFYKDPVTKEEAEKLGKFLQKHFEEAGSKDKKGSVQLLKEGDKYQVRFVYDQGQINNPTVELAFKLLAMSMSSQVFDGKSVEVHLCDDKLKTVKTINP